MANEDGPAGIARGGAAAGDGGDAAADGSAAGPDQVRAAQEQAAEAAGAARNTAAHDSGESPAEQTHPAMPPVTLDFGHTEPEYSPGAPAPAEGAAAAAGGGWGGAGESGGPTPQSADRPGGTGAAPTRRQIPRRVVIGGGAVLGLGLFGGIAAAVSNSGGSTKTDAAGGKSSASPSASPSPTYPPATITTVPADGASGVDPSQPVTVTAANGSVQSVVFSGGQTTTGTLSADGSTWTSNGTLSLGTDYSMQVQVLGKDGRTVSSTVAFTTLSPSATIGVDSIWPGDGVTVGVGQPIRIEFTNYVPQAYRSDVEKACVVTTNPPVAGAWYWPDDNMMDWRPEEYWAVNSQVSVAFNLNGVRAGDSQYFEKNHSIQMTIRDTDLRLIVDAAHFQATCYQNGQQIRNFPIDTGMDSEQTFVTWSGVMAVLDKGNPVRMVGNYGPDDTYDELVNWATQVTYSGTYVHAAPWDPDIGSANDDSHGCIHCNTDDAEWFYGLAQVGDVVQVTGTDKTVSVDNGFGDWSVAWTDWLSGSNYGATLNGSPVSNSSASSSASPSPSAS
ncbi:MAG TPA: Ig-like domain-containing protein [Actinocrinis sp.]|jgi:lipoprotein-anchoring transpeptidase ErfK/SrfK